jgi:hypothetical protein
VALPAAALVGAGGERDGADDEVEHEEQRGRGEVPADRRPRAQRRRDVGGLHRIGSEGARCLMKLGRSGWDAGRRWGLASGAGTGLLNGGRGRGRRHAARGGMGRC